MEEKKMLSKFSECIQALEQTRSKLQKIELLEHYFSQLSKTEAEYALGLLLGIRPKRPVSTTVLREWLSEFTTLPLWLVEQSYEYVGDLGESISLLLQSKTDRLAEEEGLYLEELIQQLEVLKSKDEFEKKAILFEYWNCIPSSQLFVFNKMLSGNLRVGISKGICVQFLSKLSGIDEDVIAMRLNGLKEFSQIKWDELIREESHEEEKMVQLPFCLANSFPEESMLEFEQRRSEYQIEYKWDGIRAQIIVENGKVSIWSRGESEVSEQFPDLVARFEEIPQNLILDGEIIAGSQSNLLGFHALQKRLNRKTVSKNLLKEVPVSFVAYDILRLGEGLLIKSPLVERRLCLEKVCFEFRIDISSILEERTPLVDLKVHSDQIGAEGIMIKHKQSVYARGRKAGVWYKWKRDPYTIDAVLTYAMKGHGRRASLFSDYTFGLWKEGELQTFAKAYSGLSDAEIKQVDVLIKQSIVQKFGPVVQVTPQLVFEIGFEGISESSRHKSGYAVRFPRILRWRTDKTIEEANSIEDLAQFLPKIKE